MMGGGGGGPTEVYILYPKKLQLQNLSTQKIHYLFLHTQNNRLVLFSQPQKIPASFIDGKKSLLVKISDPKNHSDPPVIKICEWGLRVAIFSFSASWETSYCDHEEKQASYGGSKWPGVFVTQ